MGSILVSVPDIADKDLRFNEAETREILRVFWPSGSARIDSMPMTDDARRLAQTALIAAIDGSNQMGYVEALFRTAYRPNPTVTGIIRALARQFVESWWQHTKPQDLKNAHLYQAVINAIAFSLRSQFEMVAQGLQLTGLAPRFVKVATA
jgi:hypothetical protein